MDFKLTKDEEQKTAAITSAAYDSWVLVNDYFSWEKEWDNFQANGSTGVIANSIFLFMRWYSLEREDARKMLRKEIVAREDKYCKLKEEFISRGAVTEKTRQWLELLDLVTAGNFAWSMTTARYRAGAEDAYPSLWLHCSNTSDPHGNESLARPISLNAADMADKIDTVLSDRRYLDLTRVIKIKSKPEARGDDPQPPEEMTNFKRSQISQGWSILQYEEVSGLRKDGRM